MPSLRLFVMFLLAALALAGAPLTAADKALHATRADLTAGEDLHLIVDPAATADHACGILLYDSYARLVGVRWLPPPPAPAAVPEGAETATAGAAAEAPAADPHEFAALREVVFCTTGLPAGTLTAKFGWRETIDGLEQFRVQHKLKVTLKAAPARVPAATPAGGDPLVPAPAAAAADWRPDHVPQFWRSTPLAVAAKEDWEQLLTDTRLAGPDAPFDGPVLVLPRGTMLSARMIETEIDPLLAHRGLLVCETWPTPSLDDAVDLSTIVSPTAPVVKLPDIRPIAGLTGLSGPAIPSDPSPADWLDRDRATRLLARRDPGSHRLYGLAEASFCCLTTRLQPAPGTTVLRYAADGSPAMTLRLIPGGGAVVVLNAAVDGYAAAAQAPARAVDYLGVAPERARELLAGARGGVALRDALAGIHARLAARRESAGNVGPYFYLNYSLSQNADRCLEVTLTAAATRRTLPAWMPPAAIRVELLRNGEVQQAADLSRDGRSYAHAFRITLNAPADGWILRYANPFSGETVEQPLYLNATPDLTVIDGPAS